MLGKSYLPVLAGAVLLAASAATAQDKPNEPVKETVKHFLEAIKAKDIDTVMKAVEVPWYHDGKEVVGDRAAVKARFEKVFQQKDFSDMLYEIENISSYAKFLEVFGPKLKEDDRKLLDQVLTKDDHVVLVRVESQKKADKVLLLVGKRKEELRVVGLRD